MYTHEIYLDLRAAGKTVSGMGEMQISGNLIMEEATNPLHPTLSG